MMSLNILIADDSATSRSYVQKNLELADIHPVEIFQCKNGQEAYDFIKANRVDLLFLDINMPVMNGIELVEKLNQENRMKIMPVVVISSEGSQIRIQLLKEWGVKEFLRKPFTPEMFSQLVNRLFGGR